MTEQPFITPTNHDIAEYVGCTERNITQNYEREPRKANTYQAYFVGTFLSVNNIDVVDFIKWVKEYKKNIEIENKIYEVFKNAK